MTYPWNGILLAFQSKLLYFSLFPFIFFFILASSLISDVVHLNIEVILFIKLPSKSEKLPPPTLVSVSLMNGNGGLGLAASRRSIIGIFGFDISRGAMEQLYLFGSRQ